MPNIQRTAFAAVIVCCAFLATVTSGGAEPAPYLTTRSTFDEAAKQQILNSAEWRRTKQYFNQWLSVQLIYNAQQVADLKAKLDAEIKRMSAAELRGLQQHVEAKLKILLSREGNEARDYIGRYLSVLATHKADELRSRLPDVVHMQPKELQDYLSAFQKERSARQHEGAAFDAARQRQVAAARNYQQQANDRFNRSWQQHQANIASQTTNYLQQSSQRSLDAARRDNERSVQAERERGRFYPGLAPRYGWGGFRW